MKRTVPGLGLLLLGMIHANLAGAQPAGDPAALASWVALNAPTGHEHLATGPLSRQLAGWTVDRHGNLLRTAGAGRPHRVVACGLDWHAFAVSQITDTGYLRLHRIAAGTGHPLWDQAHEGQHVRVLTRGGPVVGVTAIANGHFAEQHRRETDVVTADDLWVDVGAASVDEVRATGIQLLDPVVRNLPAWSYANEIAGPGAGARSGCAAVVAAAASTAGSGRTTWVLSAQHVFGWVGLGGAIRDAGPVDEVIVLGPGRLERRDDRVTTLSQRLDPVLQAAGVKSIRMLAPRVADAGALMERIELAEARTLLQALLSATGSSTTDTPRWVAAPTMPPPLNSDPRRWATGAEGSRLTAVENLLDRLAETPAVPGHEGPVRAIVMAEMPEWARSRAQTDDMGNVWIEVGPAGEATVFMAHMDEVGWEVEAIGPTGEVRLRRLGGPVTSAWEGQPARLQLDAASGLPSAATVRELNGVFATRAAPDRKTPDSVSAWFGLSGEALTAAGVRPGMGVTGYKEGHRIGRYRYAARSLDDRTGTTALLMALKALDPAVVKHRVIFAWSVREEGGLVGAGTMAARFGAATRRIYSVDTFVSSDTPLESPHFAFAPLGAGPVLRSIENGGMSTPSELDRNLVVARSARVKVQVGLTQGTTDGTMFTFWGAPNAGLSWPGRYSHSPAEVLDLRDVAGLSDLILAMALAAP